MGIPGSVIAPNVSSALYASLEHQGLVVVLGGSALFLALWRLALFSADGTTILGRRIGLGALRAASFDAKDGDETAECLATKVLRISFGLLWILDAVLAAKSSTPSQIIPGAIAPAIANQPGPIAWLMRGGLYFWRFSPVAADTATIWIQLAIGVLLILGSGRRLRRIAALASIGWAGVIWVFAEGFGGLGVPGASLLGGAPGAALVYGAAGAILLLGEPWLASESKMSHRRIAIGAFWIAMAALQAFPAEGFWSASNLSAIFSQMSAMPMSPVLDNPLAFLSRATASDPPIWNLILVAILVMTGVGIITSKRTRGFVYASLGLLFLNWWLGMAIGIVGSSSTSANTNTSLPFALVTISLLLVPSRLSAATKTARYPGESRALGVAIAAASLAVGLVTMLLALPAAASGAPLYAAVADGGGVTNLQGAAAPNFSLRDQFGNAVSMATFQGKAVILTFLDPVCYDVCGVIASEITKGVAATGRQAPKVAIVAININPSFTSLAAIRQFDAEHSLGATSNWYFLTGSLSQLNAVWKSYLVTPSSAVIGKLSFPQVIYFLSPKGAEIAVTGNSGAPTTPLVRSYANLVASTAKIALDS